MRNFLVTDGRTTDVRFTRKNLDEHVNASDEKKYCGLQGVVEVYAEAVGRINGRIRRLTRLQWNQPRECAGGSICDESNPSQCDVI